MLRILKVSELVRRFRTELNKRGVSNLHNLYSTFLIRIYLKVLVSDSDSINSFLAHNLAGFDIVL